MNKEDLILKLLEEFRAETNRRFEQIDRQFEQVVGLIKDERHEREKLENKVEKMSEKLDKIYETRYEVEYKITRDFILKNVGWNLGVITVGLVLGKLILLS